MPVKLGIDVSGRTTARLGFDLPFTNMNWRNEYAGYNAVYGHALLGKTGFPETLIVEMLWNKPKTSLPDVFGYILPPWAISPRLRELIESLEPNTHTFHAVEIRTTGAFLGENPYRAIYYWLDHPPEVDCIDRTANEFTEYTDAQIQNRPPHLRTARFMAHKNVPILNAQAIRGRHLWRLPKEWQGRDVFVSDEFVRRYKALKLQGWDVTSSRCQVV
jgi:hypothetical protein